MYAGETHFETIVNARQAFLDEWSYEKTIHERNFKHWLLHVEHLVNSSGHIQSADVWHNLFLNPPWHRPLTHGQSQNV